MLRTKFFKFRTHLKLVSHNFKTIMKQTTKVGVVFGYSEMHKHSFDTTIQSFLKNNYFQKDVHVKWNLVLTASEYEKKMSEAQLTNDELDSIILYPLTGGTENLLRKFVADHFAKNKRKPIIVYCNELNNSIASAIELREYFRDQLLIPSKLCSSFDEMNAVLENWKKDKELLDMFLGLKLGLIGEISSWLINEESTFRYPYITIPMSKFHQRYEETSDEEGYNAIKHVVEKSKKTTPSKDALTIAGRAYVALRKLVEEYQLDGFSIGCFKLIGSIKGTPCLALALFNALETGASCEGELNALLPMVILRKVYGKKRDISASAFMGNIANYTDDTITIAHCTAPLLANFNLKSHFESDTGVGVQVSLPTKTKASLMKMKGRKVMLTNVEVVAEEDNPHKCRTQLRLKVNNAKDFIDKTLGNHHLLVYKDAEQLKELFEKLGFDVFLHQ